MTKDVNPMLGVCKFSEVIFEAIREWGGYPETVLELGCATGENLKLFKESLVRVGIEPYVETYKVAQAFLGENAILGDHRVLEQMETNQFGVGFTCSVLDHIENYRVALQSLCRVCRSLVLFEPIREGAPRQAKQGETKLWQVTWYHDYEVALQELGVPYKISPCPLYPNDSGPYYHKICVECEE